MKRLLVTTVIVLFIVSSVSAQVDIQFDKYFENTTMRIDYYHIADSASEFTTLDKIYRQGIWAGSKKNLLDNFNNGRYYVKIYDAESDLLIFTKGYDSYCGEYRTSEPAKKGIKRTYHESVLIPYPKQNIKFTIENRDKQNLLHPFFNQDIDPTSNDIISHEWLKGVSVYESHKSGHPNEKVDMAIIGEGYADTEQFKFIEDLNRFTNILFDFEPFLSQKDQFNIYGLLKFSEDTGTDEPRANIYRSTAVNTTFNSMGSERYLLTEDNKSLRDIAAHVPYDALLIMVNHKRYGGGGIYNFFLTFTTDNQWHEYLFVHEFGHSFAGLADEYYTSSTAYDEFYPKGLEPVEPNITALLNPDNLKWKNLVKKGTKAPTPWEKKKYDEMDLEYQKLREKLNDKIANLKRENASSDVVKKAEEEFDEYSKAHQEKMDKYLAKSKYVGVVGAFEGAGYTSQGLYRPMLDCLMFSKGKKPFCKVCENAIISVIKHFSE